MLRAAAWILAGLPLAAQPPQEARVPFYGQELVYRYSGPASAGAAPLVVLTEGVWDYWQAGGGARGWSLVAPVNIAPAATDTYAKALEAIVADAIKRLNPDPLRVYLAGTGRGVAAVFYARGRVPHLWAAAFAAGGDPAPAIDSNRLFTANAELVPLLWAGRPDDQPAREKLRLAGYPFEWRDAAQLPAGEEANYLAGRARPANPPRIEMAEAQSKRGSAGKLRAADETPVPQRSQCLRRAGRDRFRMPDDVGARMLRHYAVPLLFKRAPRPLPRGCHRRAPKTSPTWRRAGVRCK
jgi:hypothetical protein